MDVLFFLRSDRQHILVRDTIMAVLLFTIILRVVLIDSGRSFLLRSDGQYMLLGDTIMAVFLVLLYCVTF